MAVFNDGGKEVSILAVSTHLQRTRFTFDQFTLICAKPTLLKLCIPQNGISLLVLIY